MNYNLNISDARTNAIAFVLIAVMLLTAFNSFRNDSATMDELAHIPAGYSYLSQKDYRLNPEHPPLVKDFAAIPLTFLDISFPSDSPSWTDNVNDQWIFGWQFLYNSGNDADQILFWSRLPMIAVLGLLAWFLFWWTKKEFGNAAGLLVLVLFAFSPAFIAHGRLVTTDVGAVLGFVLTAYFYLKFLKYPSSKNVIVTGLVFGFAMLLKFSLLLLIPFFGLITLFYILLNGGSVLEYLSKALLIGIIGTVFVILPVYCFHTMNYPVERQVSDTTAILESFPIEPLKNTVIWMSGKPVLRSLAHYFLGLMMASQRTLSGNTVYFLNMISSSGWWYYFPLVYLMKVPLSFHVMTLIALILGLFVMKRPDFERCVKKNFTAFSMAIFLLLYWGTSMAGSLNIGIRHILPVFPFTYILVSLGVVYGIEQIQRPEFRKLASYLVIALICWYVASSVSTYPYYLSYFNEAAGGTDKGYEYVVDSNYDWGQDAKRLARYVEENNIDKIKVDYFGGADMTYYLKDKWEQLDSSVPNQKGWLAISVGLLQAGKGVPVHGFDQPTGYYNWLNDYEPVARAGKSIFLYHIQ